MNLFVYGPAMKSAMMIQFSHHALFRAREQGTTLEEIEAAPASGDSDPMRNCATYKAIPTE